MILLIARFIQVHYLEWLANVVLLKKANSKWRMSVDYTYFEKICLKDFHVSRIDQRSVSVAKQ